MIAYIVCEGPSDAMLLERILPQNLLAGVTIVSAGGLSATKSLSRSLIISRRTPVAIVADADSVDQDSVEERRRSIEEIVGGVAIDTPVKVFLAVPELEIIFFWDYLLLARLLGCDPSREILNLAISKPKKALQLLLDQSKVYQSRTQLISQLTPRDSDVLRKAPVIQELIHFLQSVQETAKAV